MYCNSNFLRHRSFAGEILTCQTGKETQILPAATAGTRGWGKLSDNQIPSHQTVATARYPEQFNSSCLLWKRKGGEMRAGIYFSYLIWNTCRTWGKWSLLKFTVLLNPSLLNSSQETLKWYPGHRLALYRDGNYTPNYKIWYCPNNNYCAEEVPTQGDELWPLLTKTAK